VKDINIGGSKKFNTTDKQQEDGIRNFDKPQNQKQGGKCMNFMFRCNLQSIGNHEDLNRLNQEISQIPQAEDVMQYKNILINDEDSPCDGFPIYMMFEVFHVQRKTLTCIQEEKIKYASVMRHIANLEIQDANNFCFMCLMNTKIPITEKQRPLSPKQLDTKTMMEICESDEDVSAFVRFKNEKTS